MNDGYAKFAGYVLVTIIAAAIVLCWPDAETTIREGDPGISMTYFEYEGMPCIHYKSSATEYAHGGLTCDWDQWTGRALTDDN